MTFIELGGEEGEQHPTMLSHVSREAFLLPRALGCSSLGDRHLRLRSYNPDLQKTQGALAKLAWGNAGTHLGARNGREG